MNALSAKKAAAAWVMQVAAGEPWFQGAYFAGSIIGMPDQAELSESSDVDLVVVMDLAEPPIKLGKFVFQGALLEITYLSLNQLSSAEEILTSYHLAGSFRVDTIIADPSGHLRRIQIQVSRHFAEYSYVHRRCKQVLDRIDQGLAGLDTRIAYHDLVTSWLFPTGVTTHLFLVAALKNPTVRRRYRAAREVLIDYGYEPVYETLLDLLGCRDLASQRIEKHLDRLEQTFDAAAALAKTPFPFSSDISEQARPIAIEGSRELIHGGYHREAVFWIIATFARCHKILAADAPENLKNRLLPDFQDAVADLGLKSDGDFLSRAQDVRQALPQLWQTTLDILQRNPDIQTITSPEAITPPDAVSS